VEESEEKLTGEFVAQFYNELNNNQEPLGIEFEKVLYNNLWELYEL
jgi:hypothetical protein